MRGADVYAFRWLDAADLLMCVAALVYFAGIYRLQGLWFGVLPADRRRKRGAKESQPGPPLVRSEASLRPAEFFNLIFIVPTIVLLSEFAWLLLSQRWSPIDLPVDWRQLMFVSWFILLAMFVSAHFFRMWRRLRMDRATAMLMLQDILWQETRGEQRKIQRWLAWRKKK
jgi:hypothetical protein